MTSDQDARDQAAQATWVANWAGWDAIPYSAELPGWNALRGESGLGDGPMASTWAETDLAWVRQAARDDADARLAGWDGERWTDEGWGGFQ